MNSQHGGPKFPHDPHPLRTPRPVRKGRPRPATVQKQFPRPAPAKKRSPRPYPVQNHTTRTRSKLNPLPLAIGAITLVAIAVPVIGSLGNDDPQSTSSSAATSVAELPWTSLESKSTPVTGLASSEFMLDLGDANSDSTSDVGAIDDAGIVVKGETPYVIVVTSNAYGYEEDLSTLVKALDAVHTSLVAS